MGKWKELAEKNYYDKMKERNRRIKKDKQGIKVYNKEETIQKLKEIQEEEKEDNIKGF